MAKQRPPLHPDAPLRLNDHARPVTRRELIAQGFKAGVGTVIGGSMLGMLASPHKAMADLSEEIIACGIRTAGAGKIPFICFDLAGGANIAGSNVLIGKQNGQMDFLSAAGYSKLGLPGDMVPNASIGDFINTELGLAFHSDSQMLQGILEKFSAGNRALTNGAIIPARSENDTGNNPHNPMYGINRAGADGELLALIGSRAGDSGGNSMAPAAMINPEKRPTKVDNPQDVRGLVDVGDMGLAQADSVAVMESIYRISDKKLQQVTSTQASASVVQNMGCQYVKSADLAARFGDPSRIDVEQDDAIVGPNGIFTDAEFNSDGEFRKTASVMKLVVNGFAGAGTITMGGYDYHTGDRSTGEARDLRAGRCIGACLQYAAIVGVPIMVYVCSDGSVFSNGMLDDSMGGRGKGVWTGDNQQGAASFFLVYNPGSQPVLLGGSAAEQARHQQIGYMRASGDVETASSPAANNVNLLVETVVLNYMALHNEQSQFASLFAGHGLGNSTMMDRLTAFEPICNGTITTPIG